jgi:hypothetical protein
LPVSFSSLLPLGGSDIVYMTGTRDNDLAITSGIFRSAPGRPATSNRCKSDTMRE